MKLRLGRLHEYIVCLGQEVLKNIFVWSSRDNSTVDLAMIIKRREEILLVFTSKIAFYLFNLLKEKLLVAWLVKSPESLNEKTLTWNCFSNSESPSLVLNASDYEPFSLSPFHDPLPTPSPTPPPPRFFPNPPHNPTT